MIDQQLARVGTGQGQVPAPLLPAPGPATTGLNPNSSSPGAFGGGSPFAPQFGGGEAVCSEEDAQKQQASVINTLEAWNIFEATPKAVFVDVREEKTFRLGRIPGAINIPSDKIKENVSRLPKDKTIILYESGRGSGDVCAAGHAAGRMLLAHGFSSERVKVYQDGLAGWEKAGLPVDH
jgi:rhodanese-related sulfurtransferase